MTGPMTLKTIVETAELEAFRLALFSAGKQLAFVPTMGALHRGHLALVKAAQKRARRVVVSIFVNPTQFAPHEDFGSYPRRFETDMAALTQAGADLVWAPPAGPLPRF